MERRLVTIFAADAVGYSRLVGENEEAALALFDECRSAIEDFISKHQGRIFGGAGDSVIAEFQSPVEALRCAVEIQDKLAIVSEKLPAERRMQFRIGLNLGDAVVENGILLGEAVNVGSRLEGVSEPGGICISGNLYEQVKHLPGLSFRDLGLLKLKNIQFAVHGYAVQRAGSPRSRKRPLPWTWVGIAALLPLMFAIGWNYVPGIRNPIQPVPQLTLASEPSVAILPLGNTSGDPSQDYFSNGLTNDITTDLSKFSNLFVIANNSAATFKDKPTKAQDIGNALGVRYLLEGTVQKTPDRLRINAQLIDTATGHHLWADRFDRKLGEVFAVQDEIVQQIVASLAVKVTVAERQRLNQKATTNMNAYDYYLRGKEVMGDPNKLTVEGNREARQLFEKAIELDPTFSRAYADLAYVYVAEYQGGWSKDTKRPSTRPRSLQKRPSLSAMNSTVTGTLRAYWNWGEFDKSFIEYEAARKLNPNNPDLAADMAEGLIYAGDFE